MLFHAHRDRLLRYRRLISLSHHLTLRMGGWFPKAVPLCYVVGFPKSGTTWVSQMIAEGTGVAFPEFSLLPLACPAVFHSHHYPKRTDLPGVHVLRDGRDALVSYYFYLSRTIPEGPNPKLTRYQKRWFPGLVDKTDIQTNLPRFIEAVCEGCPATGSLNWAAHAAYHREQTWDRMPSVRYEDLLADPETELTQILTAINRSEPDPWLVQTIVEKYSFARMTGRKAGTEDRKSFLRKGRSGDWRNHFTAEARQVFDRYCGDALIASGYESDRSWVTETDADRIAA